MVYYPKFTNVDTGTPMSADVIFIDTLPSILPSVLPSLLNINYINASLSVSSSSNSLTITVNGSDGLPISSSNKVGISFRNSSASSGLRNGRVIESPLSITISSGSTLGVTSATAFRLWIVASDDAGTVRLGVTKSSLYTVSGVGGTVIIYPLVDDSIRSTVAEGGAGAADSSGILYTSTTLTNVPMRVIGYIEWNTSGLVTAGQWTTTNLTNVYMFGPGTILPGGAVQTASAYTLTGSNTTSTSFVNVTGTTVNITQNSPANFIKLNSSGKLYTSLVAATNVISSVTFGRNGSQIGPISWAGAQSGAGGIQGLAAAALNYIDFANSSASIAYTIMHNTNVATNSTFTDNAYIAAEEIMS